MAQHSIFIGFDPREAAGFAVTKYSAEKRSTLGVPIFGIAMQDLINRGLYTRPMEYRNNQLWDLISDAPCSTQFAISRFFTPKLARDLKSPQWAIFMDCDMMWRAAPERLFELLDPQYAVMCVKHDHTPHETVKMDDQMQVQYARKNWSSLFAVNVRHPANDRLTLEMLNTLPGRDLHRFCWLEDDEIGALPLEWNWLIGYSPPVENAKCVHFTNGTPDMPGYEYCDFADEWREHLWQWSRKP